MRQEPARTKETEGFLPLLLTLMAVVFSGFLIIGIALPVLPRQVHNSLGFGMFTVGLVTGAQFAASLLSRFQAGKFADDHGGKRAIIAGLLMAATGGGFYLLSLVFDHKPVAAVVVILIGRTIVGGAESFIITGGMTLGLILAGEKQTGRVIAWVGTAMFAAFALGAPIGTFIFDKLGFSWIAMATVIVPFVSFAAVKALPEKKAQNAGRGTVAGTLKLVWLPGLGAAFNGVGYAALLSFSVILFADRGWTMGWLPVTAFALALIATRLLLGQLVDQIGGKVVGITFTGVTAAGQLLLWFGSSPWIAALGAAMTGAGWAMIYPAFGAQAVRRVAAGTKGLAMASYSAFPDLAIGLASPLLGLVAPGGNIGIVYLWSSIAVLMALPIALVAGKTGEAD